MKWRNEFKYFVSDTDILILKHKLSNLLPLDENTKGDSYLVRSLYFDDFFKSGISNKLDGTKNRVRYRIRQYNNEKPIKLEAKIRSNQAVSKISTWLNEEEYEAILSGQLTKLQCEGNHVLLAFFVNMRKYGLRPAVIVEYDRVAYLVPGTDVRITLDLNVRSYKSSTNLLNPEVAPVPVFLYPRQQILEVKFYDKIPAHIKNIIQSVSTTRYAISKFSLCSRYIRSNSWEDN